MPETEYTVNSDPHKENNNQKQIHLSQDELDEVASWDQKEAEFIEQLNLDQEEKKLDLPPLVDVISLSTKQQQQQTLPKEETLDQIKQYVQKCLARQDLINDLAAMDADFFERLAMCTEQMTETSLFQVESFISVRLDRIIHYSKEFSQDISTKLTTEESKLYIDLSELIQNYKDDICKKLKITD